jgi:hypothetical protein
LSFLHLCSSVFAPLFHIGVRESGIVPGFHNSYVESWDICGYRGFLGLGFGVARWV